MPEYNLHILGLDLNFKTDAGPERIEQARAYLEKRFAELQSRGGKLSKERLLIYVALGLADDYLQSDIRLSDLQQRVEELVHKINGLEADK
ncbi:cell division protein ZapA [Desulfonatronospira sp.]|uniref:cell division protein ZapA n=1 Tax=Desulfonatronospira sp. TaxID=1962951 RepID=UPI0025C4B2F1|nr:cell division protein ZapA [Desulfonatronospira sp.]